MQRGQVSVEFIVILVLLFSLLLFSIWAFGERNSGYVLSRENHEARLLAGKIAGTVNAVYLAGKGAETKLLLEKRADLNASISGNAVVVSWRDNYVDAALLTDSIAAGSIPVGAWVNVENVNGAVVIEAS